MLIQLLKLRAQRRLHFLNLGQVKLLHLRLIGNGQCCVQALRALLRSGYLLHNAFRQHQIKISNAESRACDPFQILPNVLGSENAANRVFQFREFFLFLNLDRSLFETHRWHPFHNFWSARRESNPRPTAWKAVTLPLSYSRPKPAISYQPSALSQPSATKTAPYFRPLAM